MGRSGQVPPQPEATGAGGRVQGATLLTCATSSEPDSLLPRPTMQQTLLRPEPARCSWVGPAAGSRCSRRSRHGSPPITPPGRRPPRLRAPLGARLPGWWVAAAFLCGSSCFTVGAFAASFPGAVGSPAGRHPPRLAVRRGGVLHRGGLLQWLEALNGDVGRRSGRGQASRAWAGGGPAAWATASSVQLVGPCCSTSARPRPRPGLVGAREPVDLGAEHGRLRVPLRRELPRLSGGLPKPRVVRAPQPLVVDRGHQPRGLGRLPGHRADELGGPPPARWSGPTCSPWSAGPASSGGLPADPRALRRDPAVARRPSAPR